MSKMLTDETQIGFHTLCGKHVMLSPDNLTAKREGDAYDNGLCFTEKPLKIGNVFQVKIQEMDSKWIGCLVSLIILISLMCSHDIHAISALVIADRAKYFVLGPILFDKGYWAHHSTSSLLICGLKNYLNFQIAQSYCLQYRRLRTPPPH